MSKRLCHWTDNILWEKQFTNRGIDPVIVIKA